jgi:hypothetical protein
MAQATDIDEPPVLPAREEVIAHTQSEAETHLRTAVRFVLLRMTPEEIVSVVTDEVKG